MGIYNYSNLDNDYDGYTVKLYETRKRRAASLHKMGSNLVLAMVTGATADELIENTKEEITSRSSNLKNVYKSCEKNEIKSYEISIRLYEKLLEYLVES